MQEFSTFTTFIILKLFCNIKVLQAQYSNNFNSFNGSESLVSSIIYLQKSKREVQLNTNLDEHTGLTYSITTEEKILYVALALGVLLAATCCCVCWKYCFCDVRQSRTIIYQQMPSSQVPMANHGQVRLPTFSIMASDVDTSERKNLIPMTTHSLISADSLNDNATGSRPPPYSAL